MTAAAADSAMRDSPWLQAGRIAFVALYICTALAALRWLTSNVREVSAEHRAVVIRAGALTRVASSGLLWAWPQPIDQVRMVPAAETVLEHHVQSLLRTQQAIQADAMSYDDDEGGPVSDELAGSGYLLTGDSGIVQLDVRVYYKVTDPFSYVLQDELMLPALERLVERSAVTVCAGRDLDTILVARPELIGQSSGANNEGAAQRERLRSDLLIGVNQRLQVLRSAGMGLGIEATRVDVQSSLPRDTINAFNAVLTASQQAEQGIADARTEAARAMQIATQASDRSLQVASALASERLSKAQTDTASVLHLAESVRKGTEPGLLMRVYRERMPGILAKAGSITTVSPGEEAQVIVPGAAGGATP
jgi:regulator of protease activity HflC (stomatin/prohibitin superfamily)